MDCNSAKRAIMICPILVAAAVAFGCGGAPPPEGDASRTERIPGRWREVRRVPEAELTDEMREQIERLEAIGYVAGSEDAGGRMGVTLHDTDRAQEGLNLYVSGHAPVATLMDMEGEVVHSWSHEFHAAFPDVPPLPPELPRKQERRENWRRVHLLPDGGLLAIFEGNGLIRLDRDSKLLWARANGAHHDLWVHEDGRIFVLTREGGVLPRIHPDRAVLEDFVSILSPDGELIGRISLLEAFERSEYLDLVGDLSRAGDLFHTNTLEILDGSLADAAPAFRAGNALISQRETDVIAIVDLEVKRVVWASRGDWKRQHQPSLLPGGRMLLFDNQGHDGMSKVIEFEPFSGEIVWAYEGDEDNGFYSETCGSSQRLSNGNTLIVESDAGRAFEVTPEGQLVWEFHNPARAGKRDELIATLFDLVRIESGAFLDWLPSSRSGSS